MENILLPTIEVVNEFVRKSTFLEFSILEYSKDELVVVGSSDLTYYHNIEIRFKNIDFLCCKNHWTVNTQEPFIQVLTGSVAYDLNSTHGILKGNNIFKLSNEDGIMQWIACETLDVKVIDVRYDESAPLR